MILNGLPWKRGVIGGVERNPGDSDVVKKGLFQEGEMVPFWSKVTEQSSEGRTQQYQWTCQDRLKLLVTLKGVILWIGEESLIEIE